MPFASDCEKTCLFERVLRARTTSLDRKHGGIGSVIHQKAFFVGGAGVEQLFPCPLNIGFADSEVLLEVEHEVKSHRARGYGMSSSELQEIVRKGEPVKACITCQVVQSPFLINDPKQSTYSICAYTYTKPAKTPPVRIHATHGL